MNGIAAKNKTLLMGIFILVFSSVKAQVKIGSAGTPNANAVLELDGGTNKGLLLPRLTNTQITALTTAPDGMIVYNTTDGFLYVRKTAAWQKITDATNMGGGGFTLPYNGTSSGSSLVFTINSTASGDAITGNAASGDAVTGISNAGRGGYFTSSSGPALVTATGNVGIANTSPQFPLDVNGRVRIKSNGANNSAGIWFDKIYTANAQSNFIGTFNDSTFGIYGGGNWKFLFDHINNNFGVNNSNPQAPLSLSNANGNKLDIYYGSANARYGIGLQSGVMQLYCAGVVDNIVFGYGSSTSFTENMRIEGNGNVGIGIASPNAKLDIRDATDGYALYVSKTGTTEGIPIGASNNSAYATLYSVNSGSGPSIITGGRVGINNTNPSAEFQLDVAGRMRLRDEAGDNTAGVWFDGTTSAKIGFIGTNTNSTIGMFGSGSGWSLLLSTDNGNVSIGTGAAANSKLQVAGSVSMPYTEVTDNYSVTDNDYAIRFVATLNTNFERAIYLPAATGRAGRIYKISARIPLAGPANGGTFNPTRVYVVESGTNINVIQDNLSGTGITNFSLANYESYYGVNYNLHGIIKQLSLTVQSNGTSWKIIDDSFSFIQDNREEQ